MRRSSNYSPCLSERVMRVLDDQSYGPLAMGGDPIDRRRNWTVPSKHFACASGRPNVTTGDDWV
jgi:hypothetical protein